MNFFNTIKDKLTNYYKLINKLKNNKIILIFALKIYFKIDKTLINY